MRSVIKQFSIMTLTAVAVAIIIFASTNGFADFFGGQADSEGPSIAADSNAVDKAPDFRLTDIRGRQISLASLRGKVAIIDFWATWCPPCRVEIPTLNDLQTKYGPQGLEIVGIALDQRVEEVKTFLERVPLNYRVVHGNEAIVSQFGGVYALPTVLVLDHKGNIRSKHIGLTRQDTFEKEIEELLSEKAE